MPKRKAWNKKYNTASEKLKAQMRWNSNWRKNNLKTINFAFNKNTYPEVEAKLDAVENKTQYILGLILKDLGLEEKE